MGSSISSGFDRENNRKLTWYDYEYRADTCSERSKDASRKELGGPRRVTERGEPGAEETRLKRQVQATPSRNSRPKGAEPAADTAKDARGDLDRGGGRGDLERGGARGARGDVERGGERGDLERGGERGAREAKEAKEVKEVSGQPKTPGETRGEPAPQAVPPPAEEKAETWGGRGGATAKEEEDEEDSEDDLYRGEEEINEARSKKGQVDSVTVRDREWSRSFFPQPRSPEGAL